MFRLLDVQWDIDYQYEMLKLPFVTWSWLLHYKQAPYSPAVRGNLSHLYTEVAHYTPGSYDAVILHLDPECLEPNSWERGRGSVYRELDALIQDVPKFVIMHGTPYHRGTQTRQHPQWWLVNRLKQVVGSNTLIVCSNQAAIEWQQGQTILQGFDAEEWYDSPKIPRVLAALSKSDRVLDYHRRFLFSVREELARLRIPLCILGVDIQPRDWSEYRAVLGSSMIYLQATPYSAMPRGRIEAMLSGCCLLTTPYHGAAEFINNGENGFLLRKEPKIACALIQDLLANPHIAKEIGQNGLSSARKLFGWSQFAHNWKQLLCTIIAPRSIDSRDYRREGISL